MGAQDDIHIQTERVRLGPLDTSDALGLSLTSPWPAVPCVDRIGASQCSDRAGVRGCVEARDRQVITADQLYNNPASDRVLAKLGFEKVGQGIGTRAAWLEPAANTLYRLNRQNFEA